MPIAAVVAKLDKLVVDVRNRFRAVEQRTTTMEQNSASWNYISTAANRTLVSRDFVHVTAANVVLTLPATPMLGHRVAINTTDLTTSLARNGSRIMGKAADLPLNIANVTVYLTYMNATRGWVLT